VHNNRLPTGCAHKAVSDCEHFANGRNENQTLSMGHAYTTFCLYFPHLFSDLGVFRYKRSEHDVPLIVTTCAWKLCLSHVRECNAHTIHVRECNAHTVHVRECNAHTIRVRECNAHTILTVRERHVTKCTCSMSLLATRGAVDVMKQCGVTTVT
jgi:hypothetical protein